MNDALRMQISAFVDGELPENEAELLLRRLNQDLVMREQVATYLAIGRFMRRDAELPGMDALRGRIASALGEDALPAAHSAAPRKSRFLKPALGFAVAASVAVLAVVGLRQSVLPEADDFSTQGVVTANEVPGMTQAVALNPGDEVISEELRQMYRRHTASSADFGANGIITRLVAMELQGGELIEVAPNPRPGNVVVTKSAGQADDRPDLRTEGTSVDGEVQVD